MTDNERRLLEQICASPHDVQLRLVYADALLARGDERGEYIQLTLDIQKHGTYEIAKAREPDKLARWSLLRDREPAWTEELGFGGIKTFWELGFPAWIDTTIDVVLQRADVINLWPIKQLSLWSDVRDVAKLVAMPVMAHIEKLLLGANNSRAPIPRNELAALASAELGGLREISFGVGALDDAGVEALATAPWIPRLERLGIDSGISGAGLAHLLACRELPRLRELSIMNCGLGDRGGRALADCTFPQLQRLTIGSAWLREGAAHLFASPAFAHVTRLIILTDDLRASISALGRTEHARELRRAELRQCEIDDAGATALATAHLPNLERLDLDYNQLGRDGAVALAQSTTMPALRELEISRNPFPTGTSSYTEFSEHSDGASGWYPDQVPFAEIQALFAHRPGLVVN